MSSFSDEEAPLGPVDVDEELEAAGFHQQHYAAAPSVSGSGVTSPAATAVPIAEVAYDGAYADHATHKASAGGCVPAPSPVGRAVRLQQPPSPTGASVSRPLHTVSPADHRVRAAPPTPSLEEDEEKPLSQPPGEPFVDFRKSEANDNLHALERGNEQEPKREVSIVFSVPRPCLWVSFILCLLLITAIAVVGGVCGSGLCSASQEDNKLSTSPTPSVATFSPVAPSPVAEPVAMTPTTPAPVGSNPTTGAPTTPASPSTLAAIQQRGRARVGVSLLPGQAAVPPGARFLQSATESALEGFNVDLVRDVSRIDVAHILGLVCLQFFYCCFQGRAVAAAVLGEGYEVDFVIVEASDRFQALANGTVDVLASSDTYTMERDLAEVRELFAGRVL